MIQCPNCGHENPLGQKFCGECGSALARQCPTCGATNVPTNKFCGECGAVLDSGSPVTAASATEASSSATPHTAIAERRLVSVLFADLVGFTTLSESRDSEEVRELLSRYFDVCRALITRYGGTVEKFIGDAVMAVWGAPVANEDDPERAVRAALDLVDAVAHLGTEVGASELRARAGVLTGEAAVNLGAAGEGMVAGDLVNTASRIQSEAEPGTVYVGDSTRRATDRAVAYQDAGTHSLKGKAEPVALHRALRVISGVGGAQRTQGLEPPFVGRDRDLRLVKELFHASAEEGRAHLVSITGIAGIGKSRLVWEFEKYIDGLAQSIRWHRGRCLAYGEGVTYWALAEMVRTRADIVEGEDTASARQKLRAAVEESVTDPEERRFCEPRLAVLLGLEEGGTSDRANLFAAWRLFYERLAQEMPTVMVFEDLQWADPSLLEFIGYLMEWSRSYPLFVITLGRPEAERALPGTGRNSTSMYLEPLSESAMKELLSGLVPGLPEDLSEQILARAEGVPLYAVETVRMLLSQGLLVPEGAAYRLAGPVGSLEVPETLHALIAARLDGLDPEERRLVQDAAVLGKTFTTAAAGALSGLDESDLEKRLGSLVGKEVLSVQTDPRSPERGQYGFLQDLVRTVAYETLSKRDRKERHLAAADYLQGAWGNEEEEIVEVVASHYLQAYELAPDAEDADQIRERARSMLARAGERAAALAAHEESRHYFDQAAGLADDAVAKAEFLEQAAIAGTAAGSIEGATKRYEQAVALFEEAGLTHPAARVSARLAEVMWDRGRSKEALDRMDRAFSVLRQDEPDEDLAALAAQLGRFLFFGGSMGPALERIETALDIAEALFLPEILSQALNTKAVILYSAKGRRREGLALLRYALEVAQEADIPSAALRAYYNLADLAGQSDRYQEAREHVDAGLALARRLGDRRWEWQFLGQLYPYCALGEWERLLEMAGELPAEKISESRGAFIVFLHLLPWIHIQRGQLEEARVTAAAFPDAEHSDDTQEAATWATGRAAISRAEGRPAEALEFAELAMAGRDELGPAAESVKEASVEAIEAAFDMGDLQRVAGVLAELDAIPKGKRPQYLDAHTSRFRARLAATRGEHETVEQGFKGAAGLFRELSMPFWTAVAQLELGEWLLEQDRGDQAAPHLEEAEIVFERLGAKPWLERLARVETPA